MTLPCSRRELLGLGIGSAASAWLSSACCPQAFLTNYRWNNALRTDGIDPKAIFEPASLRELVSLIQKAEQERAGVRMVGAGHSFSDVAMSAGYLLRSNRLDAWLELDRSQLKTPYRNDPYLVRTESGMRLRQLNPALLQRGLALTNMGGWDAQSLIGAASTGTHGSGLAYGPIASQLVSLQLVTTGGQVIQLEPHDGMTDPAQFPGYIESGGERITATLQQDDEAFNAVVVSMGCMGVIYAAVLRAVPRFWLREVRELTTWGDLTKAGGFLQRLLTKQRLEPHEAQDPDHYEIYFNPYPPARGKPASSHSCLLTKRYRLAEEPAHLSQDARRRGSWGSDLIGTVVAVTGRGNAVVDYLNAHPQAVPRSLDDALAALQDKSYIDLSYNVFNLGPANLFRAYGIEMAFDLAQIVKVTERHFAIAADLREHGVMHVSPPSIRFVASSDAHLAMMYGRQTAMLEIGMLVGVSGADQLLKTYERKYIDEFAARPHWGLDLQILQDFSEVKALYPAAERWHQQYQRFNARGTFNGELTDRLGISIAT